MFRRREPRASFGSSGNTSKDPLPHWEAEAPPSLGVFRREAPTDRQTRNASTSPVVKMKSRGSLLQYHRTLGCPVNANRLPNPRLTRIIRLSILLQHRERLPVSCCNLPMGAFTKINRGFDCPCQRIVSDFCRDDNFLWSDEQPNPLARIQSVPKGADHRCTGPYDADIAGDSFDCSFDNV